MFETLFAEGTTVITAGRRLARHLLEEHGRRQAAAGVRAWRTPDVLPLAAWLRRSWLQAGEARPEPPGVPLTTEQERALWEECVRRDPRAGDVALLQVHRAAEAAAEAHGLLAAWRRDLDPGAAYLNADAEAFLRWRARFLDRCRRGGWIDAAAIPGQVVGAVAAGAADLPARIVLAGFDELTPQEQRLCDALAARGCEVVRWAPPACTAHARRAGFADGARELEAAARWARALLEGGAHGSIGPIGIVVRDLDARRGQVERIFGEILHPGGGATAAFNISLGEPLSACAVVRDALLALRLAAVRAPVAQWSEFLRSPYFAGAAEERGARARTDARLREWGAPGIGIDAVLRAIARNERDGDRQPALRGALERMKELAAGLPRERAPAQWAQLAYGWLRAAGWPRGVALDSAEYQAMEAFEDALGALESLGPVTGAVTGDAAFARLRRMLGDTVFQPRSGPAPIQVLGVLETAGMRFSRLWVCGMEDRGWPRPPRPNPFLPLRLQRDAGMPRSGAARELAFAETVSARLLASAPEVVVSFPRMDGDTPLRVSPLFAQLEEVSADALARSAVPGYARAIHDAGPEREPLADDAAPPVADAASVRGGTSVIRDQAACPFRAFAAHRLRAVQPETPQRGLDARARGNLAHDVLHSVWGELGSHAELLRRDAQDLERLVMDAVDQAIETLRRDDVLCGRFRDLERERLTERVMEWLDVERQRAPFVVVETEEGATKALDGLTIKVRPDRVDRLDDGRVVVIDYKTGGPKVEAMAGERPDEPQLPLYALLYCEKVSGVAFACLRRGEVGLRGLADGAGVGPGVDDPSAKRRGALKDVESWDELVEAWKRCLPALAREFLAGAARPDPRQYPNTCQYCPFGALCRIGERRASEGREP